MRLLQRLIGRHGRAAERGQGLVEFAMVLPVIMTLILGGIEFGFMFNSNISLEYASREGARVGSALVNGGGTLGCGGSLSPNALNVDPLIIEAVNRVLTSPGSPLLVPDVQRIRIYQADAAGNVVGGNANVWLPTPGAGPFPLGSTKRLDFTQSSAPWDACSRQNVLPTPDSIGVEIIYLYRIRMPFLNLTGLTTYPMRDVTIMSMNPTS